MSGGGGERSSIGRRSRTSGDFGVVRARLKLVLLAFSLSPGALAVETPNIRFDQLSIEDGLSMTTVNSILQDSTGFMWFGTQDGLNRYDGDRFLVLRNDPADPATLSHDWIRSLLEDGSGDIWVGTRGGGLNRWHRSTDTFSAYRHDPDDPDSLAGERVWALLQSRSGDLWIGTELSGLDRFVPESGVFEHYRHDPGDPASLSDDRVRALYQDRSGRLWVGTLGGLNLLDPETGAFTRFRHDPRDPHSLSHDGVRSILEDHEGGLWIGTLGGLNRVVENGRDPLRFERFRHDPNDPRSLSEDRVRVLFEDRDRRLWIGTDGGLNLLDHDAASPGEIAFFSYRHRRDDSGSLGNDRVAAVYQDRGGVLWVATEGAGVSKWDPRTWSFSNDLYRPSDLSSNYILSVTEDGSGNLWLGTNGHGVNRLRRATGEVTQFRHDPADPESLGDSRITALLHDREGTLWLGTLAGGLDRFDPATETFEHATHDPKRDDGLGAPGVMSLFEDRQGMLWVGTFDGGLSRLERWPAGGRASFETYRHDPADRHSLSGDRVTAFAEEEDEVLWVGTYSSGLNRFDRKTGVFLRMRHHPNRPSSLASDTVFALHFSPSGILWVGTQNGLEKLEHFDPRSGAAVFTSYREPQGLPTDVIYAVYSDDRGRLWLATTKGLSRFDPVTETFKNFDASHGLMSEELNQGAHYQSPAGELVFGGIEGFNAFYPDRIEGNTTVPPVVLTSFSKLNRPVRLERPIFDVEEIALSHQDKVVSFEFAALDYTAPERNRYRYRLEGFDDDWIDLGHRRMVSFTNLDSGRYVLRVQGSNNDGVWNEAGASLRIVVAPPPWGTWWAYALYVLAAVGMAWAGAFVYAQRQQVRRERAIAAHEREQRRERERLIEERDHLIEELETKNAELERFTYTVSHDLKSPLVTIRGFLGLLERNALDGDADQMRRYVQRISEATTNMQTLLDDLLQLARLGHQLAPLEEVPLGELAGEAIQLVGGRIAERAVEIEIAKDLPVVSADRGRLLEVYQNLIENAVKYMGEQRAPRVEVGIERNGAGDVFFVRDNGMGIEPRYHDKVFGLFERLDLEIEGTGLGLALVKRIVEMHGGRIWIESEGEGRGSIFYFTLPVRG